MSTVVRRWLAALCTGALAATLAAPSVAAAPLPGAHIVVNATLDAVADDGYCTLREALSNAGGNSADYHSPGECAAGSPDAADTITFTVTGTISPTFVGFVPIDEDLVIQGPGASSLTIDGGASFRALTVAADTTVAISGLTLLGHATNGGALDTAGTVTLTGVTLHGTASANGGAIRNTGQLELIDSTVSDSSAGGFGGGIHTTGGLIVRSSIIDSNAAHQGGGIASSQADVFLDHTLLAGNTATTTGGGAYAAGANFEADASTIAHNWAGSGGGVDGDDANVTVVLSELFDNHANGAGGQGGAIRASGGIAVDRSTITSNAAAGSGAGIYAFEDLVVQGSTISHNHASDAGGGIFQAGGLGTIVGSTIARNWSANTYGGIVAPALVMHNSIVLGNQLEDASISNLAQPGHLGWIGNVIEANGTHLDNVLETGAPYPHGGLTGTIRLAKVADNIAYDAADAGICASAFQGGTDQRGVPRGDRCDAGAVQHDPVAPVMTSAPKATLRIGTILNEPQPGSASVDGITAAAAPTAPITLTWAAKDNTGGSGIATYDLQQSINGGAWQGLAQGLIAPRYTFIVPTTGTIRFRARAVDNDDNPSAWATGPVLTYRLVQQNSTTITWKGSWSTITSTSFSGGTTKSSKAAGASATITFTGRAIALVSWRDLGMGKVTIYYGTRKLATVDLGGNPRTQYVAWQYAFSTAATRTIRLVVAGTTGRPQVTLDAVIVQK